MGKKTDPLLRIARDFRRGLLVGRPSESMCYMICAPLEGYLRSVGYDAELVEGELDLSDDVIAGHYWIRLPDGRIIDPTADQFKTPKGEPMPEVYVGELPGWYRVCERDEADRR